MRPILIFDLDGTLVNSLPDIAAAMNTALKANGLPVHSESAYAAMVGNGAVVLTERACGNRQDRVKDVYTFYRKQYSAHLDEKTHPYPGMPETLISLREQGYALGVISNKNQRDVERVCRSCFPDFQFDAVIGCLEGEPLKPDPACAARLTAPLGASQGDILAVIGDSAVDAAFAHGLGVACIGCAWGFRGRAELEKANAEMIADSAEEIPALLSKWVRGKS